MAHVCSIGCQANNQSANGFDELAVSKALAFFKTFYAVLERRKLLGSSGMSSRSFARSSFGKCFSSIVTSLGSFVSRRNQLFFSCEDQSKPIEKC